MGWVTSYGEVSLSVAGSNYFSLWDPIDEQLFMGFNNGGKYMVHIINVAQGTVVDSLSISNLVPGNFFAYDSGRNALLFYEYGNSTFQSYLTYFSLSSNKFYKLAGLPSAFASNAYVTGVILPPTLTKNTDGGILVNSGGNILVLDYNSPSHTLAQFGGSIQTFWMF